MENLRFILLVPVLLVHCFIACLAMTQTKLTTDQSALLALKDHISFDPDNIFLANNWSITSNTNSCCNWIGVGCGIRHQRVTYLNISNMGLTGTIPPHIGNFSFLVSLDMGNNNFQGHLPDELIFLRRLKVINLGSNNLSGVLPSSIFKLSSLRNVHISSNSLSGSIPREIGNSTMLQVLDLGNNNFGGGIPEEMGNLVGLKILSIKNNSLTGPIPSAIFNISSIEIIDLANNKLSGSLPEDANYHLKELYLSHNQLGSPIPNALWIGRELRVLTLSFNQFQGSIPREIGNLTAIEMLYLGHNNFIGEIPKEVSYLHGLKNLSMLGNKLTGSIPPGLFNISSLVHIDLQNGSLSGGLPIDLCSRLPALLILSVHSNKVMGSIPRGIGNCTSLVSLDLSYNMLTGSIPQELGNLRNIVGIFLGVNGLSGPIPSNIFNISTLEYIALTQNYLSGQLPPSIGFDLPNLKGLFLPENNLSGMIPNSISNASKLTDLDLCNNLFTGFIPDTLGNLRLLQRFSVEHNSLIMDSSTPELRFLTSLTNCQYLTSLLISNNFLNGILPTSIGNFSTSLLYFSADRSSIKGNIPREIGNLSSLIALKLGSNKLTGTIPPTLGRLQNLQFLGLPDNKLHGPLPYDLCLLRALVYLYLSRNELSGSIPTCIDKFSSLRFLYLDSNKFISIIPSALSSLTDILEVNLSTNSLIGNLPLAIGSLKVVGLLDLSKNQFSGDVPSTIGNLQNLVILSLAHNRLQGPIPQLLGNLISLELLDLSGNNFSGIIPNSLEKLRYLQNLNVSFNSLQGEIPQGGPFAKFSAQSFMMNDALCGAPRLQVPPCKPRRSRKTVEHLLKYALPAIVIMILALLYVLMRTCRKRNVKIPTQTDWVPPEWRRISYQEILQATDGFSESNLLGNGSYGSVYKGILSEGVNVAVKVFNLQLEGAFKSFDVECEVLCNIRHRNLIKIISSCSNNLDFKALVLDYMPNGSLEKWLYSDNYCLDILQRVNIMIDVALAVEYLHHGYPTPIVHCDLKPSNILLDGDMVAHVGDFGIAKLFGEGEFMKQTMTLATVGYMAPEYGTEGIVSTRGDVYSYGIMLMEIFTRKKPTDEFFAGEMNLKRWVANSLHGSIFEVVDPNLLQRTDDQYVAKEGQCVASILGLALNCSEDSPEERINFQDVVSRLNTIKNKFLAETGKPRGKVSNIV